MLFNKLPRKQETSEKHWILFFELDTRCFVLHLKIWENFWLHRKREYVWSHELRRSNRTYSHINTVVWYFANQPASCNWRRWGRCIIKVATELGKWIMKVGNVEATELSLYLSIGHTNSCQGTVETWKTWANHVAGIQRITLLANHG